MLAEVVAYILIGLMFGLLAAGLIINGGFYRRSHRTGTLDEIDRRSVARKLAIIVALAAFCGMTVYVILSFVPGDDPRVLLLPVLCAVGSAGTQLLMFWVSTATLRRQLWLRKEWDRYRQSSKANNQQDS